MKKFLSIIMALVTSNSLGAYDFKVGDLYYNIISNNAPYTVEVTYELASAPEHPLDNYLGLTDIIIPESVTYSGITYSVTSIGAYAFCDCTSLTSIAFPNSITTIGVLAFSGCTSLHTLNIPEDVTTIGAEAFSKCASLSGNIKIPNGVTNIASGVFGGCSSLTSIAIHNNVTSIEDYAFNGCTSLTSINIPSGITSIGEYVFYNCTSLPSITLPDGVTSIGAMAFGNCSSLASITIPNGITTIEAWAFSYCSGMTSVTCKANTPPTVKTRAFFEVPVNISVYVPCESLVEYQNGEEWSYFTNIQCMSEEGSAIENTHSPSPTSIYQKQIKDGQLLILHNGNTYNITGQEL